MRTSTIVIVIVIVFLMFGELIIYMRLLYIEKELELLKEGRGDESEAAETAACEGTLEEVKSLATKYDDTDVGIMYILPSKASSDYWAKTYGDRIFFYAYANLTEYVELIRNDWKIIADNYSYVGIMIPGEDTPLFYQNLAILNSIANETRLQILWVILPKWKYGREAEYLIYGTKMNELVIKLMNYLANLSSTKQIAVWYGWEDHVYPKEIETFYKRLPDNLKSLYAVWVDQPFIKQMVEKEAGKILNSLNLTVITEFYDDETLRKYGCTFRKQVIVTGYYAASDVDQWLEAVRKRLLKLHCPAQPKQKLLVWIFWDVNDGQGELFRAYINGKLSNPLKP